MGAFISDLFNKWFGNRETRILMIGLDAAGKTTIIHKLIFGEDSPVIPIGFSNETAQYKNLIIGHVPFRLGHPLWRHYIMHNVQGLIFVIDCNDVNRIEEARKELFEVLEEDELRDTALLVYANKQDLPNAINPRELINLLELNSLTNRSWQVQGTCGTTGDGLYEGLDWLVQEINKKFW